MVDYDKDRRSVYMGNLPCSMTADRLESIVGVCGVVLSIEMKRKAIADIHGISIPNTSSSQSTCHQLTLSLREVYLLRIC